MHNSFKNLCGPYYSLQQPKQARQLFSPLTGVIYTTTFPLCSSPPRGAFRATVTDVDWNAMGAAISRGERRVRGQQRRVGAARHPAFPAPSFLGGLQPGNARTLFALRGRRPAFSEDPSGQLQRLTWQPPAIRTDFDGNWRRKWSEWQDSNLRPLRPERK